jgi:hypothetical protein
MLTRGALSNRCMPGQPGPAMRGLIGFIPTATVAIRSARLEATFLST